MIALILTVTSLVNDNIYALSGYGTQDQVTGPSTSTTKVGFFEPNQQGIRIYAVDSNFNIVSTVLDICNENPFCDTYTGLSSHIYSAAANQDISVQNSIKIKLWSRKESYS